MDVRSRRQLVLNRLLDDGRVSVQELSRSTGVSEMTIRRDLDHLVDKGIARRVYGGAELLAPSAVPPEFATRAATSADQKRAIGAAAARLIRDDESVIVDSGTTCVEVARALAERERLTVCPLGFQATAVLAGSPGLRVLLPGGELHPQELAYLGPIVRDVLGRFRFDSYVMAVTGVSATHGVTDAGLEDAEVKLAALGSARRIIVAVDATKLGVVAFTRIAPLDRIDALVTDAGADPGEVATLRERGIEVVIA